MVTVATVVAGACVGAGGGTGEGAGGGTGEGACVVDEVVTVDAGDSGWLVEVVAAASPPEPTRLDADATTALTTTTTTAEAIHQRHWRANRGSTLTACTSCRARRPGTAT